MESTAQNTTTQPPTRTGSAADTTTPSHLQAHTPTQTQQTRVPQTQAQSLTQAQQTVAPRAAPSRPWWRPPARNYRPHPGNHAIDSYFTTTSLTVARGPASEANTSSPSIYRRHSANSESLPHYWFRSFNYILRIPFRELIGNISRPYDPTAPLPLADVPLNANIIDTQTNQSFTNPYTGQQSSTVPISSGTTPVAGVTGTATTSSLQSTTTTTRRTSVDYIPQIRKSWKDRTADMSWALSTAFFTSIICTVVAMAALGVNWDVDCTYLKVFLVAFVVRKWVVSFLMMDRALYRLPLGLTEPDPDIDEERHNGIAIYMSHLFTWHGYAMLIFGSLYVFFYGSSHYMSVAPVITGVAIAFGCMGLVPFFSLLIMMLGALILLYVLYIVFVCMIWPLEKCGLSRRRAISRRNGGYQSNGTTNTTDLRQVERAIEDAENDEAGGIGGGGFGGADNIKVTPAMAAIPIIIFRKSQFKKSTTIPEGTNWASQEESIVSPEGARSKPGLLHAMSSVETVEVMQDVKVTEEISSEREKPTTSAFLAADKGLSQQTSVDHLGDISGDHSSEHSSCSQPTGDRPVVISIPSSNDSHNDAINKMPSSLSALCNSTTALPQSHSPASRSRASSSSFSGSIGPPWVANVVPQVSSTVSFIPCATGQELTEAEGGARVRPATPSSLSKGSPRRPIQAAKRDSASNRSGSSSINMGSNGNSGSNILAPLASEVQAASGSGSGSGDRADADVKAGVESFPKDYPTITDDECAICLFDFEDGDELRHLYCDHFFHRSCVDRWLAKNAFCPKCKRAI